MAVSGFSSAEQLRAARKQLLSRRVNEQVHRLPKGRDLDEYVCECVHAGCIDPVAVTFEEYEEIRSQPGWFVVRRGHRCCNDERVVRHGRGFQVIEKVGYAT